MWKELAQEFPNVFDHYVEQTLWNTAREREMSRPLIPAKEMKRKEGVPHEQIAQDRLWNKRPDGIAFKMPTKTKVGVICLMEFKRMSDVTIRYVVRAKSVTEEQYESFRSALRALSLRQDYATPGMDSRTNQLHRGRAVPKRSGAQDKHRFLQGPQCKHKAHQI